jgi:hypothetical protein
MKKIRKPDLNAPRFRAKRKSILTKDKFSLFKEKYPEHHTATLKQFKEIVMTYNSLLADGVIDNRDGIELPDGLGFIFMASCPPTKKQNINYAKSFHYGVQTNHKNWDSDNRLLKIFYSNHRTKYPFTNKQVWSFKAVKQFRKKASEEFKDNWSKYIEVSPLAKISKMFDAYRKKDLAKKASLNIPKDYNEFNI